MGRLIPLWGNYDGLARTLYTSVLAVYSVLCGSVETSKPVVLLVSHRISPVPWHIARSALLIGQRETE